MRPISDVDVAELRRIADRDWDVLDATGARAAGTDRYDHFLQTAALMLSNGQSEVAVGDYLVDVEIECLGVDSGGGIRERAQIFARSLLDYLEERAA